jgi:serine protease Do
VILKVDGRPVEGPGPLQAIIEVAAVGKPLALTIDRNGQVFERSVLPEPQPDRLTLPTNGQGGININVPGGTIVIPGPNPNLGPPAGPAPEFEPPLNAAPPPPTGAPFPGAPATGSRPPILSRPANPNDPPPAPPEPLETAVRTPTRFPELGLRLSEPSPALIRRFRLDREPRGLFVTGVEPDGPADRGGLEIGMVITDAAGQKVTNLAEFREAMANRPANRDLLVRILKGAKAEFRVIVDRSGPPDPGPIDLPPPIDSPRLEPTPGTTPKDSPTRGERPGPSPPDQRPD